jgi:hypothetical protein
LASQQVVADLSRLDAHVRRTRGRSCAQPDMADTGDN